MSSRTYKQLEFPTPTPMSLDSKTTALIIVDMQNDYCRKNGKHYAPEFETAIPKIGTLLAKARAKGMPIMYTMNWLSDPQGVWKQTHEKGWTTIPPHCLEETWGAEIVDELKPTAIDYVIKKASYSMFLGSYRHEAEKLMEKFKKEHPSVVTFIVVGTDMNVCVFFNSDALYWFGYGVVLPLDCIGGSPWLRCEKGDIGYDHGLWFLSRVNGARITASELIKLV